jgi:hypothetical protein
VDASFFVRVRSLNGWLGWVKCGVGRPWSEFKWIIESKMALGFTVWRSLI